MGEAFGSPWPLPMKRPSGPQLQIACHGSHQSLNVSWQRKSRGHATETKAGAGRQIEGQAGRQTGRKKDSLLRAARGSASPTGRGLARSAPVRALRHGFFAVHQISAVLVCWVKATREAGRREAGRREARRQGKQAERPPGIENEAAPALPKGKTAGTALARVTRA